MKNKMVVLGLCAVVGSLFSSVVPERQDPAPKDGIRDFVVTTDRADDFSSAEVKVAGDGTAKLYDAAFQEVPLKLDRPRTGRGQLRPGADEEVCFPVQSETWGCDLKVLKRSAGGIATRRARPIRFVRVLAAGFAALRAFPSKAALSSAHFRPAPIGLVSLHFDFPFVRGPSRRAAPESTRSRP